MTNYKTNYKTGDMVEGRLKSSPKWKRGTVSHVNEGNNVLVRFDDEADIQYVINFDDVKPVKK